jgi:hypothetical protein
MMFLHLLTLSAMVLPFARNTPSANDLNRRAFAKIHQAIPIPTLSMNNVSVNGAELLELEDVSGASVGGC